MAKKTESKANQVGGMLFVGSIITGTGLGLWTGRPDIGSIVGVGIGFMLMAAARISIKD